MKLVLLLLLGTVINIAAVAQSAGTETQVAEKIAQKMKDTLSLSAQQKDTLYTINMQLASRKVIVRQQYTGSDSLQYFIQRVERSRDSLYRQVLNDEKYLLYKAKKRNLVNNN